MLSKSARPGPLTPARTGGHLAQQLAYGAADRGKGGFEARGAGAAGERNTRIRPVVGAQGGRCATGSPR